jgi:hypothetical protein
LFEGLIYQFVYNLERHSLFEVSLRRWLILLCLIVPAALWFEVGGATNLLAGLVTAGAALILVALWQAGRQHYVRFVPDSPPGSGQASPPLSSPLPAMSEAPLCASGFFEVSGMRRYFVEVAATYTTFETREHCVMTRVPFSRFLLLGTSEREEAGWWYTFFQPAMVRVVTGGRLYFGLRPRTALQLQIASTHDKVETLYLSFADGAARSLILADLLHDAVPEAGSHHAQSAMADENAGEQGHNHQQNHQDE